MNRYRKPVGHRPYFPQSDSSGAGRWAGACSVVLLMAMILLGLMAVDRVASTPAAHPAPTYLEPVEVPDHGALVAEVGR